MGIKMKSEKGRKKKEKQPRRISQPHLFSKRRLDQATRGKKKRKEKRKGKRYTDPSKPTPLMPATQKKCTSLYRFVARITANSRRHKSVGGEIQIPRGMRRSEAIGQVTARD
jgi:hypothetical protein